MTSIMGFAELLLSTDLPEDQHRKYLQKVHKSTEDLLAIITDILDISKLEAEKINMQLDDYSPIEIVEEVCSIMKGRADQKNLTLDFNCHFPLPQTIRTDHTRLRQILVNLVANAIKFTEVGAVNVALQLTSDGDGNPRMQFHVTDTGIGMNEEQVENLFEPFTQADNSNTRRFGGTGLGLAISARLAALMGGTIDVKSTPAEGSTFILSVDPGPLENVSLVQSAAKLSQRTEKRPLNTPQRIVSGNVLLAEDDEDIQELLSRFLKASGISVEVAPNGRVAYEKAMQSAATGKPYDLILMDIRMPEMDGYETTRKLRQEGWQGPIIAQTAHALTGDREKCLEAGCDDYVTKPVSTHELLDMIARHLEEESTAC
jgi:CheY-like chemotaxis protein